MLSGAAAIRIAFSADKDADADDEMEAEQQERVKAHEADLIRRLDEVQRGKFGIPMVPSNADAGPTPPSLIRKPAGSLLREQPKKMIVMSTKVVDARSPTNKKEPRKK